MGRGVGGAVGQKGGGGGWFVGLPCVASSALKKFADNYPRTRGVKITRNVKKNLTIVFTENFLFEIETRWSFLRVNEH